MQTYLMNRNQTHNNEDLPFHVRFAERIIKGGSGRAIRRWYKHKDWIQMNFSLLHFFAVGMK